nr:PREDICTED: E3 ubiquitin-protein ligase RNF144B-like [Musa acuminata subsp. malaccensis]
MGESQSKHRHDGNDYYDDDDDDDTYFSVIDEEEEEEEEVFGTSDDEMLAEVLQLQEMLFHEEIIRSNICPRMAPSELMAYCNICMESKPLHQFVDINFCSHKFCLGCMSMYISAKLDEDAANIRCPEPGCRVGVLEPLSFQYLLPSDTFERWCDSLCQSTIRAKFYCPFKDCSALLEAGGGGDEEEEEEEVISASECPHCNRLFCAQCKEPWHHGLDCREFQKLGEDERGREDLQLWELAAKQKWQRCPNCMITVERIDGCRFMRCRCGQCFCYICASPMSQEDHYCFECQS